MYLDPRKLHVTFAADASPAGPAIPRAYTLTHSDSTGDLFLTVGTTFDRHQISGWYTRLMRDEVLGIWSVGEGSPGIPAGAERHSLRLDIHCHVSGGLVVGTAGWRYGIFQGHMPLVIEALRYGDSGLFLADPSLDEAPVWVRFHSSRRRYNLTQNWGRLVDYRRT